LESRRGSTKPLGLSGSHQRPARIALHVGRSRAERERINQLEREVNERIEEILRNPSVLKTPEGDDYTDDTAHKWAWGAHGYDTGMEPFYSIDQLREAVRSVLPAA
jgi:hypothetical protein